MTVAIFANAGDGDGSGNGINKNISLTLESSFPADNEENVATDTVIQLDFNKNICNVKVVQNNKTCFHLTNSDGNIIPITITFPDDQVQRVYKQQVFITAKNGLKANTQYRVAIDDNIQAKNDTTIDNAHIVEFTTGSKATGKKNKILTYLGKNIQTYSSATAETAASIPKSQDKNLEGNNDNGISTNTIALVSIVFIILAALIFSVVVIKRKKRN